MSLLAPLDSTAPTMFKWKNAFSWSYNGEVADSIKEKVKAAGGCITGDFRASLSWFNTDDYDLHIAEPNGNEIYYGNKGMVHPSSGKLDVDMNVGGESKTPVENIIYSNKGKMPEGKYKIWVNNFTQRNTTDYGFILEVEFDGQIHSFHYTNLIKNKDNVLVAEIEYSKKDGFKIIKSIDSTLSSKEIWGINTNQFHKVNLLMYSPNHWDNQKSTGNKHYCFFLQDCLCPNTQRGFYNEFLKDELIQDKKVFEALGSKIKVEFSEQQLSGLGFSSTGKGSVICKVEGTFTREIKINF